MHAIWSASNADARNASIPVATPIRLITANGSAAGAQTDATEVTFVTSFFESDSTVDILLDAGVSC